MLLHVTESGGGPPLVILHGMLGQARNWQQVAKALAARYRVLALDLRGHGASPWGEPMDYPTLAADVAETMEARGTGAAALVGHSMGGKTAMALALSRPELVRALVVVDIAPVRYAPENLRLIRAMRAVDPAALGRRANVDAALAAAVEDGRVRAFLLQGLATTPGGTLAWRTDLAALERSMDALSGFPDIAPGVSHRGPALFVAGGRSTYLREAHRGPIVRLFPSATIVTIAEAGHWVHADRPAELLAALEAFLG